MIFNVLSGQENHVISSDGVQTLHNPHYSGCGLQSPDTT